MGQVIFTLRNGKGIGNFLDMNGRDAIADAECRVGASQIRGQIDFDN
jgi:hypothetical protein